MKRRTVILFKLILCMAVFMFIDVVYEMFGPLAQIEMSMLQMENSDSAYIAANTYRKIEDFMGIAKIFMIIAVFANDAVYYIKKYLWRNEENE